MDSFTTDTHVGRMTLSMEKDSDGAGRVSFRFDADSDLEEYTLNDIELDELSCPRPVCIREDGDSKDVRWAFAVWLAGQQALKEFARHAGKEFAERMADVCARLCADMEAKQNRLESLIIAIEKLDPMSVERLLARGEAERIKDDLAELGWSLHLAEELSGMKESVAVALPRIPGWPEVTVVLQEGGTARVRPIFEGSLDVSIDRDDKVRFEGRVVHGGGHYARKDGELREKCAYANSTGRRPSLEWIEKAESVFEQAAQEYQRQHPDLDRAVLDHADLVMRYIETSRADEFEMFSTPLNDNLQILFLFDDHSQNFKNGIWELGFDRFVVRRIPSIGNPPKSRTPIHGISALLKRCADGEMALLDWIGTYSNSGLGAGLDTATSAATSHVARHAIEMFDKSGLLNRASG